MAAITRRGWSSLKAEFIRGARGINYQNWPDRAEHLIWEAYLDLCSLFHHSELEIWREHSLDKGKSVLTYPDNCYLVVAVAELNENNEPFLYIVPEHTAVWAGTTGLLTSGQPKKYTSFNRKIFLDKRSDKERRYRVFFIRYPQRPDFDSDTTYPETGEQWDGHLIESALYKAGARSGQDDVAERNAKLFVEFASQQPQPRLAESTAPNRPQKLTQDRPQGGLKT